MQMQLTKAQRERLQSLNDWDFNDALQILAQGVNGEVDPAASWEHFVKFIDSARVSLLIEGNKNASHSQKS